MDAAIIGDGSRQRFDVGVAQGIFALDSAFAGKEGEP
jgi:hypothetical protein